MYVQYNVCIFYIRVYKLYIIIPFDNLQSAVLLEYEAISMLTVDFLQAVNEICDTSSPNLKMNFSEKCYNDSDLQTDWHICSKLVIV